MMWKTDRSRPHSQFLYSQAKNAGVEQMKSVNFTQYPKPDLFFLQRVFPENNYGRK